MIKFKPAVIYVAVMTLVLIGLLIAIGNDRANGVSGNPDFCTEIPAHTTVEFDHWQRYLWTGGPHTSDDPPAFPSDDWQPNTQSDPHNIGAPGPYFRSHGNSGNGDWFYLEMVMVTAQHPAVECPEEPTDPPTTDAPTEEPRCDRPVIGGPCDSVTEPPDPEIGTPVQRERPIEDAPLPDTGA